MVGQLGRFSGEATEGSPELAEGHQSRNWVTKAATGLGKSWPRLEDASPWPGWPVPKSSPHLPAGRRWPCLSILTSMDTKAYYEWYNRGDPSSIYRPEHEATFSQRLAWFSRRVRPGSKVLDYGCGEGVLLSGLHQRVGIHEDSCGVDISENAVRKATTRFQNLRFFPTDRNGIAPFPDG